MCTCCQSCDWFMHKSCHSNWHLKLYTFLVNYLNSSSKWKHRAKTRGCEPGTAKLLMLQWLKVGCGAWYREIHSAHHSIVCASVGRAWVTLKSSLRYFTVLCNAIHSIGFQHSHLLLFLLFSYLSKFKVPASRLQTRCKTLHLIETK